MHKNVKALSIAAAILALAASLGACDNPATALNEDLRFGSHWAHASDSTITLGWSAPTSSRYSEVELSYEISYSIGVSPRYEVRQADTSTISGRGGSTLSIVLPGVDEWNNDHTDLGFSEPFVNYGSTVTITARSPGGAVATVTRIVIVPWDDTPPSFPADALSHEYTGGGSFRLSWQAASDNRTPSGELEYRVVGIGLGGGMLPIMTEATLMEWAVGTLSFEVGSKEHSRYKVYARDKDGNVGGSAEITIP